LDNAPSRSSRFLILPGTPISPSSLMLSPKDRKMNKTRKIIRRNCLEVFQSKSTP
jgi:hypothetical protein